MNRLESELNQYAKWLTYSCFKNSALGVIWDEFGVFVETLSQKPYLVVLTETWLNDFSDLNVFYQNIYPIQAKKEWK